MTREEAVTVFKAFMENPLFSEVHKIAFNIAIHDIKAYQDWNINNLILVNKDNYEPLEQEPKTGQWETSGDYFTGAYETIDYVRCSRCGYDSLEEGDYCPNCGARMEN